MVLVAAPAGWRHPTHGFMSSAPDPLDALIARSRSVQPPLPAPETLHQEVWRRIADAEIGAEPTHWGRVEAVFTRPSFAAMFVAACTVFGLFLAEVRVSRMQAERNVQLAQAYIQLIDPLLDGAAMQASALQQRRAP